MEKTLKVQRRPGGAPLRESTVLPRFQSPSWTWNSRSRIPTWWRRV